MTPSQALAQRTPSLALTQGFVFDAVDVANVVDMVDAVQPADAIDQEREGFCIGPLHLMIPYAHGSELADLPATYRLPNVPPWFVGMSNLHGTLVPVFDLADYLDVKHAPSTKPMLLVLGHGDERAGVIIDGLPLRLRLTAEDKLELPSIPHQLKDSINNVYKIAGIHWMDFGYRTLFDRLETELIQ